MITMEPRGAAHGSVARRGGPRTDDPMIEVLELPVHATGPAGRAAHRADGAGHRDLPGPAPAQPARRRTRPRGHRRSRSGPPHRSGSDPLGDRDLRHRSGRRRGAPATRQGDRRRRAGDPVLRRPGGRGLDVRDRRGRRRRAVAVPLRVADHGHHGGRRRGRRCWRWSCWSRRWVWRRDCSRSAPTRSWPGPRDCRPGSTTSCSSSWPPSPSPWPCVRSVCCWSAR